MNSIHLYIGLDGGGSKTHLVAEATDGTTVHLEGHGSNPHREGFPEAGRTLARLIQAAMDAVPSATSVSACAGVAGAGSPDDQEALAAQVQEALGEAYTVPDEHLASYPAHLHRTSPVLTLQGAVAHCDMPVESGPTMYLPHSQKVY